MQVLPEEGVPEIQRVHLAHAVLQLKAAGIDNIMVYPWLEAPPAECGVRALELLYTLGAVNEDAKYALGSIAVP
jgi:ATP-dependent RNA helicase DDX35